jgi:hypothetical protein
MNILEHYYIEDKRTLYIEFSTKEDGDDFYRILELGFEDIEYYSPTIIYEDELRSIDEIFIFDLIEQYLLDNDLPEEQKL